MDNLTALIVAAHVSHMVRHHIWRSGDSVGLFSLAIDTGVKAVALDTFLHGKEFHGVRFTSDTCRPQVNLTTAACHEPWIGW